mgnify:CR=1 FL=1
MIVNKSTADVIAQAVEDVTRSSKTRERISLHEPFFLDTKANKYLSECIKSAWVSSSGNWVNRLEEEVKLLTGAKYACAVTNGTVGLRLALDISGVERDDEVIMSPLSFIATANAASHLLAVPHFVDIEKETLGMSPESLAQRLDAIAEKKSGGVFNRLTGKKISAIVVVHVFGFPAKISEIIQIADMWNLPVIEDAAAALGSKRDDVSCGRFGKVGVFSFNGNKIITTGGGGVLITDDKHLAEKARHLSTTAKRVLSDSICIHDKIGWNDRMPNINAAIGVAQLEVFQKRLLLKRKLADLYIEAFKDIENVKIITEDKNRSFSNYWLITLFINESNLETAKILIDEILIKLRNKRIESRPSWQLMHQTQMYSSCSKTKLVNAEEISEKLISLPSSPQLIMK